MDMRWRRSSQCPQLQHIHRRPDLIADNAPCFNLQLEGGLVQWPAGQVQLQIPAIYLPPSKCRKQCSAKSNHSGPLIWTANFTQEAANAVQAGQHLLNLSFQFRSPTQSPAEPASPPNKLADTPC